MDVLEHLVVQAQIGHQPLQLTVLILQRLQPFGFTHVHPAILALPAVKRAAGYAVLADQLIHRQAGFGLFKNPDDLLLGVPLRGSP